MNLNNLLSLFVKLSSLAIYFFALFSGRVKFARQRSISRFSFFSLFLGFIKNFSID